MANSLAHETLVKENHRLSQLVRKMQGALSTLRDEVTDANAEIAASKKLFDEQKQILLQELDRERHRRERTDRELYVLRQCTNKSRISVGTNTASTTDACVEATSQATSQRRHELTIRTVHPPVQDELESFADWLCMTTRCRTVDLCSFFQEMGVSSVEEVCANVTEQDLLAAGVPISKVRLMMQCIMECTEQLLSGLSLRF